MRVFTRTKILIAVATALATFGVAAWGQNLRVMGTTTGEGPAYFNGASTFGGASTFNATSTFNGTSTFGGLATFNGGITSKGDGPAVPGGAAPISMTSPNSTGSYSISLERKGEDGRDHAWRFWHMNGVASYGQYYDPKDPYVAQKTGGLQIWEYHADSQGRQCETDAKPDDGAVCASRFAIEPGGNVGLGTSFPQSKLHVVGDITADGYITAARDIYSNGDIRTGGWLLTDGESGWRSRSYGGGWQMTDYTWVRTYNGKSIWTDGALASQGGLSVGFPVDAYSSSAPANGAVIAGKVGIGNTDPAHMLDVSGRIRAREGTVVYESACNGGLLTLSATCRSGPNSGDSANRPVGILVEL